MNKKISKFLVGIASIILMLTMLTSFVFADSTTSSTFKPTDVEISTDGTTDIQTIGGRIIGIIQVIGTLVSVGILVVLGIKYMMGSAEEKAEYKKTMIPYLIGAILIFAASALAGMIYSFASTLSVPKK